MNDNGTLDNAVAAWLADEATGPAPDRVLTATFAQTRGMRQQWSVPGWRRIQMSWKLLAIAAGAAAIAVTVISGALVLNPRKDASVGGPSPVPSVPASVRPSGSSFPGQLAFSSDRDGEDDIYVVNPDGSGLAKITDSAASEIEPAWSPDGQTLAYTVVGDPSSTIWTMNADGSSAAPLVAGGTPQWSPDGLRLLYHDGRAIAVINRDGSGASRVFAEGTSGLQYAHSPSWSSDGSHVLFIGSPGDGLGSDVYEMTIAGTDLRKLTSTPNDDATPRMSPSGQLIAYITSSKAINVMNPDGSGSRPVMLWTGGGAWVSWSPDGRYIASAGGPHGALLIKVVGVDSGRQTELTEVGLVRDVAWGSGGD